jgi:DNA-binding transcriptional regulator YhcF (GntR family)
MSNEKALENGNGGTPAGDVEFKMDFLPQTEDQLIGFAKWLRSREQVLILDSRWALGDRINRSNESVYGEDTIGKIAAEAGYSKSTVHKCKQFAEKYSVEQKASLLNGQFVLSWRDIAQNLTIDPENLIQAYSESRDREEFRNTVTKLKPTKKQLVTENAELRNRVSELEAEKAELQKRIKELEGQQETSGANSDSIEETESAEDLPN